MGNLKVTFLAKAWHDYLYWQSQDKKTLKGINKLIIDIQRNGYSGIGQPKPMKDNLSDYWSKRIDQVYTK